MSSYKAPSFQDRIAAAGLAKQKALDALRAKPPVDEAILAKRRQAREAQDQATAIARAAKAEAAALAKAQKAELKAAKQAAEAEEQAAASAAAALKAARLTPPTAAEMKAARDARYAARKARK
ncbi:MAG TPA: DUF6481 family protein [Sphingobium sp.]|nr:DUF6481 family protein [Sphingobium sp.]